MTPLRAKMIDEMKLRRFAPNTQEAYVSAVEGLARFYNQSPDQINQKLILKYLLYLMEDRKLAWNICNVVVSGIRFFYTMRIRYFGFLSNRYRKERLRQCRELLGICPDLLEITKKTCQ